MPRNVRNFWVEVKVDGQVTKFKGGPRAKDGGLQVTVCQRDRGVVAKVLEIDARAFQGYGATGQESITLSLLAETSHGGEQSIRVKTRR